MNTVTDPQAVYELGQELRKLHAEVKALDLRAGWLLDDCIIRLEHRAMQHWLSSVRQAESEE